MDDLDLLHDDHALLSSQVVHVVTLIKSLGDNRGAGGSLISEVLRQTELLRQQLLEHFAFEEEEAFPRLDDRYPAIKTKLQQLQEQHERVLASFEELRSVLWDESKGLSAEDRAARCDRFESAFTLHAAEETALLQEASNSPSPDLTGRAYFFLHFGRSVETAVAPRVGSLKRRVILDVQLNATICYQKPDHDCKRSNRSARVTPRHVCASHRLGRPGLRRYIATSKYDGRQSRECTLARHEHGGTSTRSARLPHPMWEVPFLEVGNCGAQGRLGIHRQSNAQ